MLNNKIDWTENMGEKLKKIKTNIPIYFKDEEKTNMVLEFAKRLSALIEYKKLKQKTSLTKISQEIQIGKSTLSEYSSGKRFPQLDILLKLADYFKVSLDFLVGRSESKYPENDELDKRFGLNDSAIETLELSYPKEYLNRMFDNDVDAVNYLLEEIKNYESELMDLEALDKNDINYKISCVSKKQDIVKAKFSLQNAFQDLIDSYYNQNK